MLKGVDIGGTFIKVLWEDGRREKHYIKDIKEDKELFLRRIKDIILSGDPTGVGVAVAGFTSTEGKVYKSPNIPVLNGVDFSTLLADAGFPVAVGNDVSVAAFGEWFFDNRDSRVLILVAIGTGLGGGLVVEGKPFFGVCGSAMEIGHHIVVKDGYPCHCGRKGCWEAYCSSYGLERIYRELTGENLKDYEIVRRAKEGERKALEAFGRFRDMLATGLMNLVHIFNPDRIVLGGGLVESSKELLQNMEERVKFLSESLPASCFTLRFSSAGEFMGARGALAFISKRADIRT